MSKTPKSRTARLLAGVMSAAIVVGWAAPSTAQEETFKIGVVTFLSGQAAQSFGVPAWNGGQVLIEKLNAGEAPAPYATKGFGGMTIEAVVLDEAGGATTQVQEYRNLVQREKVDAVVGYVGSGDCLAVAPVADELKQFTILYDCGTPRIFEENDYDYVFRTAANATMDNVGLALYLKALGEEVSTYSGINQDYAFGQDSWADFKAAMSQVYPDATVTAELFPAFGAGQYGTEISALMQKRADVVHSSLGGGDLQALSLQARPGGSRFTRRFRRRCRAACSSAARPCCRPQTTCCRRSATPCPRASSSAPAAPMATWPPRASSIRGGRTSTRPNTMSSRSRRPTAWRRRSLA
ncbi:ABC transporter substrate-binding protein [Aurantimonas coralicida]|uniref:ABC transporter substrate-binding protein n=1 Tax=Aurantimonas coralicida TaxID=182270 RepID=UPI00238C7042|nr:ABC transporter substrate-binding protein [Aurantimonas coralicida]MDE0923908.1 ABC transporter substrate-binding protein [Aurantimonas coralicida]